MLHTETLKSWDWNWKSSVLHIPLPNRYFVPHTHPVLSCEAALAPECSWGPSYWCQNKVTANQCGQEAYCNNQIWKVSLSPSSHEVTDHKICLIVFIMPHKLMIMNVKCVQQVPISIHMYVCMRLPNSIGWHSL